MKKILFTLLLSFICLGMQAQSISDALSAIEAEQYEKAGEILRTLVDKNPDDGRYNFHLGILYMILHEPAQAKAAFEQGLTAKKNSTINHIGLGRLALDDGNTTLAEEQFALATQKLRRKDTEEYLYIARSYLHSYNPDYEKAREYANKVIAVNASSAEGYITLGDAEYKLANLNEAYMAYRNAFLLDDKMYRAKLNLAIITKHAHAFQEAVNALEEIILLDPNYGPTYRELAEVYYMWGSVDENRYDEYIAKALGYYEKYMELTDYSLDSRMRHADFLVLARDYQALEKEAEEMQKIDNVNPRILRYLGYSAYENKNYQAAIDALTRFMSSVDERRILGIDHAYLAKAQFQLLTQDDPIDEVKLNAMLANLQKAIDMEAPIGDDFSQLAMNLYRSREYFLAAQIYEILTSASNPRLSDLMFFGNSVLYMVNSVNGDEERKAYIPMVDKALAAYERVAEEAPTTYDALYNAARLSYMITGREEQTIEMYQRYIDVVEKADQPETESAKASLMKKLGDAYANIGALYLETDKKRAKEFFTKSLELDPTNTQAEAGLYYINNN